MKIEMHGRLRLDELVEYLSGELEGRMGLRSWLGPMLDGTSTAGGAADPSELALASARATNRVEHALAQVAPHHVEVLIAAYCPLGPRHPSGCGPHGPGGLLQAFGDPPTASVAAHIEGRAKGAGAGVGAERLRALLRSKQAAAKGEPRRALSQQLTTKREAAREALDRAHSAYLESYDIVRTRRREQARAWLSC